MNKNQNGFSILLLLAAVLVAGIVASGGWYVYQRNNKPGNLQQSNKVQTVSEQSTAVSTSDKETKKTYTAAEATALVQEVYDEDYARWERNQAKIMNNEAVTETQEQRINQIKDKISPELYAKLLAPYSGGVPRDRINCSHAVMPGKFTANTAEVSDGVASIRVTASYTGEYANGEPYDIATMVDLATFRIADITCPGQ